MRITATAVGLLLTGALLAGCGDDDAKPSGDPSTAPTSPSDTSPSATSEAPGDSYSGLLIERPGYTFHLPDNWIDTTENQTITDAEDAYGMSNVGGLDDNHYRLTVDVTTDMSRRLFERSVPRLLDRLRQEDPSAYKRLPDTTWGDDKSYHARGSGLGGEAMAQLYVFHHDGARYLVKLETPGGLKENDKLLDVIRSSWTWK